MSLYTHKNEDVSAFSRGYSPKWDTDVENQNTFKASAKQVIKNLKTIVSVKIERISIFVFEKGEWRNNEKVVKEIHQACNLSDESSTLESTLTQLRTCQTARNAWDEIEKLEKPKESVPKFISTEAKLVDTANSHIEKKLEELEQLQKEQQDLLQALETSLESYSSEGTRSTENSDTSVESCLENYEQRIELLDKTLEPLDKLRELHKKVELIKNGLDLADQILDKKNENNKLHQAIALANTLAEDYKTKEEKIETLDKERNDGKKIIEHCKAFLKIKSEFTKSMAWTPQIRKSRDNNDKIKEFDKFYKNCSEFSKKFENTSEFPELQSVIQAYKKEITDAMQTSLLKINDLITLYNDKYREDLYFCMDLSSKGVLRKALNIDPFSVWEHIALFMSDD